MKKAFIILAAAAMCAICYKSDLTNTTHPDHGKVIVDIALPATGTTPSSYTVVLNGEEITADESGSVELPETLQPGVYTLYVYSNSSEMALEQNINELGEGTITSSKVADYDVVESLTEDLYFGAQTITVLADQVITSEIKLAQVTRDISFNFEITEGDPERIESISASLSGIAQQWECVEDLPIGEPVSIKPTLILGESLTKSETVGTHLTGTVKVLGVQGDDQSLDITLIFTDGKKQEITIEVDEKLAGSNNTKSTPIILSDNVKTPVEGSTDGTIDDWTGGAGGSETVN